MIIAYKSWKPRIQFLRKQRYIIIWELDKDILHRNVMFLKSFAALPTFAPFHQFMLPIFATLYFFLELLLVDFATFYHLVK